MNQEAGGVTVIVSYNIATSVVFPCNTVIGQFARCLDDIPVKNANSE